MTKPRARHVWGRDEKFGQPVMPRRTTNKRPPSIHRVENPGVNHKRRKRGRGITFDEHFKNTIETYRGEVASEIRHQLDQTEKDLEEQLANIHSEFGGQLKIVAEYEDDIFQSIAEERLEITTPSPDKDGELCKEQASLAARVSNFDQVVSREVAQLGSLWKQWHQTQLDLVCLAIEVLGLEAVRLAPYQHDGDMTAKVKAATDTNRERQAGRAQSRETAAELERSIWTTAEEMVRSLDDQEKEWKVNEKKKIQRIKQIMMEAD